MRAVAMLTPILVLAFIATSAQGGSPMASTDVVYVNTPLLSTCVVDIEGNAPIAAGGACYQVPEGAAAVTLTIDDIQGIDVGAMIAIAYIYEGGAGVNYLGACGRTTIPTFWTEYVQTIEIQIDLDGPTGCGEARVGTMRFEPTA